MRTFSLLFVLSACLALPLCVKAQAAPPTRLFNVKDYGAVLDGKADDAPAIMAAFAAMKVNGHPSGTLRIPGLARISATLDFDGGYKNVTNEAQWDGGQGEALRIEVAGALRPDPGIGVAVKLHGLRGVWTDIRFDGGGKEGDIGLLAEDLDLADLGVSGTKFAGTVLYADASADKTKRIRSTKIREVYASDCGQAIFWRGIEAFGSFEFIWDRNCKHGTVFKDCADTTIKYFENFSPATQDVGLLFDECNMFSVGILSLGDRPQQALVKIIGGDFGSIQKIRVSGRPDKETLPTSPIGLQLLNVHSINIDDLLTFRCRIGLDVVGSNCQIKMHQSMTGDVNPLVIEGTPQFPNPRVNIGVLYRFHHRESVKVLDSVKGGAVHLHGDIYDMNIDGVDGLYAIDCRSAEVVLNVAGLTQEPRARLLGAIYHPKPENIRGVAEARLGNPLLHGSIGEVQLPPGAPRQNTGERPLELWITVRYAATPAAAAGAQLSLGRTATTLLATVFGDRPANTPAQRETLHLQVPPWWYYQLDLSNATVEKVIEVRD